MGRAPKVGLAAFALLLGLGALTTSLTPALAQAPGKASAYAAVVCDRACLIGQLHAYMDALTHKDPKRVRFAKDVMFTENDVAMPIGEGLWGTVTGALGQRPGGWPIPPPARPRGSAWCRSMDRPPTTPCAFG